VLVYIAEEFYELFCIFVTPGHIKAEFVEGSISFLTE
jgi:hypothetical protein